MSDAPSIIIDTPSKTSHADLTLSNGTTTISHASSSPLTAAAAASDSESLTSLSASEHETKQPVAIAPLNGRLRKRAAPPTYLEAKPKPVKKPKIDNSQLLQPATTTLRVLSKEPSPGVESVASSIGDESASASDYGSERPGRQRKRKSPMPQNPAAQPGVGAAAAAVNHAPRRPPRPKDVSMPNFQSVTQAEGYSNDDLVAMLHIREFLVRFAQYLPPSTITVTSFSRSGKKRVTKQAAGCPNWLLSFTDGIYSSWKDDQSTCELVEGLAQFIQREQAGGLDAIAGKKLPKNTDMLLSRNGPETFEQLLTQCEDSASWRIWPTLQDFLLHEKIIYDAVLVDEASEPIASKPIVKAAPHSTEDELSSDLSDISGAEDSPVKRPSKKKGKGRLSAAREPPIKPKLQLVFGLVNFILTRSEAIKVILVDGTSREKDARQKGFSLRKEWTDDMAKFKADKPEGPPEQRTDWQAEVDARTAEYKKDVADNYPEMHSQKMRWSLQKLFHLDCYLPTPAIKSGCYPARFPEAILSSWSVLVLGKVPSASGILVQAASKKQKSSPSADKSVQSVDKPVSCISSASDLHALANWLEGQVKLRVYYRKCEVVDKAVRKHNRTQNGNESDSSLSELSDGENSSSRPEVEEKAAIEFAHTVRTFAEFVGSRAESPEDEDEDELEED